jgi:acetyl-CoA acetyltransferase family protein
MEKIVIVAAKRNPFGKFGGSLKDINANNLALYASQACLQQSGLQATDIDHVVLGNVVQSSSDAIYTPRHLGLKLGIPQHVPALGVARLCGSGFQAWVTAAQMIQTGEANVVLSGGVEQMSQIPYVLRGARWGQKMGGTEVEDYLTAALVDQYTNTPMAITAENLAVKYKITRDETDAYALQSQMRYQAAFKEGKFKDEISPVTVTSKKGELVVALDEHPKGDVTAEGLKKLPALFKKDGVVTAGNASGIVDGAAMSILMTESEAKRRGLKPLAKILSYASVGCDPSIMGIGPVKAIQNALTKAKLTLNAMDLIEVNEAFAAQFLAVQKELNLPNDKTNVNGGAIALGHPLGASGTRIMNHLVYELHRRKKSLAVGSACIGGGQGIAIVIEAM